MPLLDVFDDDAFSLHSLTAAIDKLPYQPSLVGQMGVFQPMPVTTAVAIIEERQGQLSLLPVQPRGSAGQSTQGRTARKIHSFPVPHVPQWDEILAADLEGKRAFGSEDQTEVFSAIVNDRMEQMKQNHEVTREFHRIGALNGIVLDADGSTPVVNWFTQFGISQTVVTFDFADTGDYDNAAPVQKMKTTCQTVKRAIQDALGGTPFTGVTALCGNDFFDAFVNHATVRRAYERYQDNEFARNLQDGDQGFMFGGIQWINYRGFIGAVDFMDDNDATFFPTGTRNVFLEVIAPADFVETVNTRGIPIYAKQERMKWDKGIELHTQSNILYMCSRPGCLIKGNGGNFDGSTSTTTTTTTTTTTPTTT